MTQYTAAMPPQSRADLLQVPPPTCWESALHDIAITKLKLPVSKAVAAVRLLQPQHLKSLPVPRGTRKWPLHIGNNTYRHHFYRQLARILGWTHREKFPEELILLVHEVWPDTYCEQGVQTLHAECDYHGAQKKGKYFEIHLLSFMMLTHT